MTVPTHGDCTGHHHVNANRPPPRHGSNAQVRDPALGTLHRRVVLVVPFSSITFQRGLPWPPIGRLTFFSSDSACPLVLVLPLRTRFLSRAGTAARRSLRARDSARW